jgi:hypothetical protein
MTKSFAVRNVMGMIFMESTSFAENVLHLRIKCVTMYPR